MTRPRGRPPMPSAMSSPSDPVETVSPSTPRSLAPSFITEPLPKARSIWLSAASSARLRSLVSSLPTTRSAACDMRTAPYSTALPPFPVKLGRHGAALSTCFVLVDKPHDKTLITLYIPGYVREAFRPAWRAPDRGARRAWPRLDADAVLEL